MSEAEWRRLAHPPLDETIVEMLEAGYDAAAEMALPGKMTPYTARQDRLLAAGEAWSRAGKPGLPAAGGKNTLTKG